MYHPAPFLGVVWLVLAVSGAIAAGADAPALTAAPKRTAIPADSTPQPVFDVPVILLHAFSSDDGTLDRLFPGGSRERVVEDTVGGAALRRRLGELSRSPDSAFAGSAAMVGFGTEFTDLVLLTERGDGLALRPATHFGAIDVRICGVQGGVATGRLATRRLDRTRSLLLRLKLDGRPHVVVVRCLLIPRSEILPIQRRFRESVAAVTGPAPAALRNTDPGRSETECLGAAR